MKPETHARLIAAVQSGRTVRLITRVASGAAPETIEGVPLRIENLVPDQPYVIVATPGGRAEALALDAILDIVEV